jgi:hypothetical protein
VTSDRVIVAITGPSGAIYGVRVLELLQPVDVEVHLVVSRWARVTIEHETGRTLRDVTALAQTTYAENDQAAAISSGSFRTRGMVFRIIREAAAADPEIAALEQGRSAQRLRNYRQAAQLLAGRNALRPGITTESATAMIFAIGHPETYRELVLDRSWDEDAWRNWAQATLEAALLGTA